MSATPARHETATRCRWGILGTAAIARKNWQAIFHAENACLTAVASRTVERSRDYIAENQAQVLFDPAPEAVGSYEALIGHPDVDAIYIPLPTGVRKEWALRAAAAGKHVLCEKPCGVDAGEVAEIIAACEAAGVQFMDGVMFMHSARMAALREAIDDGESVGTVRRITSQFSFLAPEDFFATDIRIQSGLEPLGCLGDLGWYNIRFALWVMRYALPERACGRLLSTHGDDALPTEFSAELFFAGGVSASFYCSFLGEHQQWVNISGSAGNLQVDDFVLPYHGPEMTFTVNNAVFRVDGGQMHMEPHSRIVRTQASSDGAPGAQETNMFRTFSKLVLDGKPDPHWPEIALRTQKVLDACLLSAREGSREVVLDRC